MTLRFQFPGGSVGGDPKDYSLGPLICMTDVTVNFVFLFGALFGDNFYRTFGANLCNIYHTFSCQSLVCTKMDPLEITHFGFKCYP